MKIVKKHPLGTISLAFVILFFLAGVYAPFLASSKPFVAVFDGKIYFPLFRYLFYNQFYTKSIDLFFNCLMFTLPCLLLGLYLFPKSLLKVTFAFVTVQLLAFSYLILNPPLDPSANPTLAKKKMEIISKKGPLSWQEELFYLSDYAKLNLVLKEKQMLIQEKMLEAYRPKEANFQNWPTLYQLELRQKNAAVARNAQDASYYQDKLNWMEESLNSLSFTLYPPLRPFHWEEDAGGSPDMNRLVDYLNLTRPNRKDLAAALIFGIRISFVVGVVSTFLALLIGVPLGAIAGFYAGKWDLALSRLLEVWEAMPVFFMLLLVVAMVESKSIFIVIFVIGLFGWTSFSRYVRGEFFKQRALPYVDAAKAVGYSDSTIIFKEVLPNAIQPVLTLLPFAMMAAITSEAGLSFLGLGEEGSSSWGILMDEGRNSFPSESYLLWPPAFMLTVLLIAIALIGDTLRDFLDPRLKS